MCDFPLQILSMLAQSSEFENMQVREEELPELDRIAIDACPFDIKGGPENKHGKAAILMQVSDMHQRPVDLISGVEVSRLELLLNKFSRQVVCF